MPDSDTGETPVILCVKRDAHDKRRFHAGRVRAAVREKRR